jgi:hypothetical protein
MMGENQYLEIVQKGPILPSLGNMQESCIEFCIKLSVSETSVGERNSFSREICTKITVSENSVGDMNHFSRKFYCISDRLCN